MVGLPGDSESENTYAEQLQSWFRLLAGPTSQRKLFVLCDRPEGLSLPAGAQGQLLVANRTNFLGLAQTLAGTGSPVLVVAWGHGGKQGATPVFHVRGPRLTPHDFSTVGAGLRESSWILLFRGSGAFAQAVAGPGHRVLSSESQTMFASDPVGMSVLVKTLNNAPALSFEDLARRLGSGTAGWYSERNLARTEEPTLWVDGQKPEILAETHPADEPGDTPPGRKSADTDSARGDSTQKPATDTSVPANFTETTPGPQWKEIKAVDPRLYPEADGVILRQKISCTLGSNPAVSTEQEQYIQVLSLEGKRFGDFDVSYSPPAEEVEFLDCEVLRPDGKLIRADPDSARDTEQARGGDYPGGQRRLFSLPGVLPGAILHVHYRKQWKEFPLPQISLALPLIEELPAVQSAVQVNIPKQTTFHFAFEDLTAPDPVVQQNSYSTSYSWQFTNWPAPALEVLSPPHHGARLLLSTFADWSSFADWYGRITRLTSELTPEIEAKAKELTRGAASEREKVSALYNYVTALRYVAVPLGVNTVRPHAAANVLRNQYGDCKDKANLLNALLRAVNIDAHLVLVPRFDQAYEAVPGLSFNHAISRVRLGSDILWVDTTDDICRFGLLPPGDPGRKVLVIDGQTRNLTELPQSKAQDNRLEIKAEIDAVDPTEPWPTTLTCVGHGYPDYQMREAAREMRESHGAMPLMAAHWRPVAGSFALERQSMTPVSELEKDFTCSARGQWIGLSTVVAQKRVVRAPFWVPKEWDLALHQRRSPLFLNRGYPSTLEEEFQFKLPTSAPDLVLPDVCENVKPPLRWRIEWVRMGDDKLVARFHAELEQGELSSVETSSFQQALRGLLVALGADASFSASH